MTIQQLSFSTAAQRRQHHPRSAIQRYLKKNVQKIVANTYLRNQDDDFQHPDGYQQSDTPAPIPGMNGTQQKS